MRKWSKVFISRFGINLLVVNRDLYCFTTGLSQRQMREKSRVISPIVRLILTGGTQDLEF